MTKFSYIPMLIVDVFQKDIYQSFIFVVTEIVYRLYWGDI